MPNMAHRGRCVEGPRGGLADGHGGPPDDVGCMDEGDMAARVSQTWVRGHGAATIVEWIIAGTQTPLATSSVSGYV
jgi:hypothetical protein